MATRIKCHPIVSKRLKRELRAAGSIYNLARRKGVNRRYVFDFIMRGIEPSNPSIAEKLYVHLKPLSKLALGDARFRHVRWWKRLTRTQRNDLIFFLYHYQEKQ